MEDDGLEDPFERLLEHLEYVQKDYHKIAPLWANSSFERADLPYSLQEALARIQYSCGLLQDLKRLQSDATLSDVTIKVDGKVFHGHRCVLAAVSRFFQVMFSSGFKESKAKTVELKDMDEAIFELIFKFIYSGKMDLTTDTAIPAFHAAAYLELQNAERPFLEHFTDALHDNELTLEEVLSLWVAANERGLDELASKLHKHLLFRFQQVAKLDLFPEKVSSELIYEYMARENVQYGPDCTEEELLSCIIQWLKHDWDMRKGNAYSFLQRFRLGLMAKEKVQELIDAQILEIPECKKMMDDLTEKWREFEGVDDLMKLPESLLPRGMIRTLIGFGGNRQLCVCGNCDMDEVRSPERSQMLFGHYFNKKNKEWTRLLNCPNVPLEDRELLYPSMVVVNRDIYMAGGFQNNEDQSNKLYESKRLFKLDGNSYKWTELPPMRYGRAHFCFVHHDGFLYTVGGKGDLRQFAGDLMFILQELEGGSLYLDFAERFNISQQKWDRCYPLPSGLVHTNAVILDGKILVHGVSDFLEERELHEFKLFGFDPKTQKWTEYLRERLPAPAGKEYKQVSALVVHDGACYRVWYEDVSPRTAWTLRKYTPRVNRIEMTAGRTRRGGLRASIGHEVEGQDTIPDNKAGAFHIDGHIYVNVSGFVRKTGAILGDPNSGLWGLNGWSRCESMDHKCVAEYAFDTKKMW